MVISEDSWHSHLLPSIWLLRCPTGDRTSISSIRGRLQRNWNKLEQRTSVKCDILREPQRLGQLPDKCVIDFHGVLLNYCIDTRLCCISSDIWRRLFLKKKLSEKTENKLIIERRCLRIHWFSLRGSEIYSGYDVHTCYACKYMTTHQSILKDILRAVFKN